MYDTNTGQLIEEKVQCPFCGSTQLYAGRRGFKLGCFSLLLLAPVFLMAFFLFWPALLLILPFGFFGASKLYLICMQCGRKSRPGGRRSRPGVNKSSVGLWKSFSDAATIQTLTEAAVAEAALSKISDEDSRNAPDYAKNSWVSYLLPILIVLGIIWAVVQLS